MKYFAIEFNHETRDLKNFPFKMVMYPEGYKEDIKSLYTFSVRSTPDGMKVHLVAR